MGIIQRQAIKNTVSSYFGIVLGFISLLVVQPRLLSPEEIGLARVLFAFSSLVAAFIPLGITNLTIRYFPYFRSVEKGHHGFFGFMLLFPIIGFLISVVLLVGFKEFIISQYRRESPLIIEYFDYIFPFSLFLSFSTVFNVYLTSLFKSTIPSYLSDVFVRLAYISIIFAYSFQWLTLTEFMICYVAIYALQLLFLTFYVLKVDLPSLAIDKDFLDKQPLREMLTFCIMLSFNSLASLGLKTLDSILLGKFMPLSFVGIYAITSFIPTVIETPLTALDRIISPKIAHAYAKGDISDMKDMFYKSVKYLTLIGAVLFICINTSVPYLLNLVGKDFSEGLEVVYIISIGSLVTMLGGSGGALLIYTSKPWQGALVLVGIVIVTFISNMVLIPCIGINGAALSTTVSALLFTLAKVYFNYRRFGFQPYNINTAKIFFVMFICFGINSFIPAFTSDILNIFIRSLLLGGVFAYMIYRLKIIEEFHHYLPWEKRSNFR